MEKCSEQGSGGNSIYLNIINSYSIMTRSSKKIEKESRPKTEHQVSMDMSDSFATERPSKKTKIKRKGKIGKSLVVTNSNKPLKNRNKNFIMKTQMQSNKKFDKKIRNSKYETNKNDNKTIQLKKKQVKKVYTERNGNNLDFNDTQKTAKGTLTNSDIHKNYSKRNELKELVLSTQDKVKELISKNEGRHKSNSVITRSKKKDNTSIKIKQSKLVEAIQRFREKKFGNFN